MIKHNEFVKLQEEIKRKGVLTTHGYNAKPTAIYSNYVLDLKVCNHKKHPKKIGATKNRPSGKEGSIQTYQERSSVPPLLIIDILKHFIR